MSDNSHSTFFSIFCQENRVKSKIEYTPSLTFAQSFSCAVIVDKNEYATFSPLLAYILMMRNSPHQSLSGGSYERAIQDQGRGGHRVDDRCDHHVTNGQHPTQGAGHFFFYL